MPTNTRDREREVSRQLAANPLVSDRDLDEIEAQLIGSVPYYVPRLVAEIRRLRALAFDQLPLPLPLREDR